MARFLSTQALEDQGLLPRLRGHQVLRWAGLISILVATCNLADDLLLQYSPQGYQGAGAFLGIAPWRVLTGHFLGVFTLPLEIIGYWLVCTLMLQQAPRLFRVLFWVMAYGVVIGTVFHGTFMAMVFAEQAAAGAPASAQSAFLTLETQLNSAIVPLSLFFLVCYLTMWGMFTLSDQSEPPPPPQSKTPVDQQY